MNRFFCPAKNISAKEIIISDQRNIHHLRDVLRLKEKERIWVFDEKGREYRALIEKILPGSVLARIEKVEEKLKDKTMKLTVACAIPKKTKMDDIVDRLTQLGVDKIIPMSTQRTLIKLNAARAASKIERWRKIALSASQQSQRSTLPVIEPITPIEKVLNRAKDYELRLIPHLNGKRKTLKEAISVSPPKNILVLIGPEGDFTPQEVETALRQGFIPLTLGDLVLRVETAAVAVASFIHFYEDR